MRRMHISGLTLVAIFALSVVVSSVASAEISLWLVKGNDITSGTLAISISGLQELTDLSAPGGAVTLNCSDIFDGWVGPEGTGAVTAVLTSGGVQNTNNLLECELAAVNHGLCETSMLVNILPLGLNWKLSLELMSVGPEENLLTILPAGSQIGFSDTCLTVLGETTDECAQAEVTQVLEISGEGVKGTSNEEDTGNCTLGGSGRSDIAGSAIALLANKEPLTVSMP